MFYSGLSYNGRFANPLIMHGTLFYQEPWGNAATGGDYVAVNLQTGKEVWRINASATGVSLLHLHSAISTRLKHQINTASYQTAY